MLAVLLFSLSSCYRVTVEVNGLPSNTPEGAEIYITGEFNNWDPGDERYRLKTLGDSLYFIDLPMGFGELEYKFTRGDWTTVEKDNCGYEADNRVLEYGSEKVVINRIYSWADLNPVDCDHVTIVINSLPENTPKDALLQLAGNITSWDVGDEAFTFAIDEDLKLPVLTIYRPEIYDVLDFKITRGSLSRSEGDRLGREMNPRRVQFGEADTVFVEVSSWLDLEQAKGDEMITLIVDRIPENTPENAPIFFVGEINDWFPHDLNLRLEKNSKGQYFINLPMLAYGTEYKFTRGNWNTVEKDDYGYEIDNRVLNREKSSDTVHVSIWNWADLSIPFGGEVTIWISSHPENTPEDAELYLAGNFNNWDPGWDDWKFNRTTEGYYFIAIPRQGNMLEFKVTRGSWETVEVDQYGKDIENRIYRWGDVDQIAIEVVKWKDLP